MIFLALVEGRSQRRVRHITSIQVRNLTPFPARDALASALKQPAQQPQFTPQGHLTDDLDVAIGRKRARRFSSSSSIHAVGTRGEPDSPCREGAERTVEGVARRRTLSKASASPTSSNTDAPASPGMARRSSGNTPTVRPSHRQRTTSAASVFTLDSGRASSLGWRDTHSSSSKLPELLQDTSQRSLEKVLRSRLVETFIAITLPPLKDRSGSDAVGSLPEDTTSSPPSTSDLGSIHHKLSSVSSKVTEFSVGSSTARRGSVAGGATKKPLSRPVTPSRDSSSAWQSSLVVRRAARRDGAACPSRPFCIRPRPTRSRPSPPPLARTPRPHSSLPPRATSPDRAGAAPARRGRPPRRRIHLIDYLDQGFTKLKYSDTSTLIIRRGQYHLDPHAYFVSI